MRVRNIELRDVPELTELYVRSFVDDVWSKDKARALIEHYLERTPEMCHLAEEDGMILGAYLTDIKPGPDGLHIVDGDMFVPPEFRKRGVARMLLKAMAEKGKILGATRFDTYTTKDSFQLEWYKSLGAVVEDRYVLLFGFIDEVLSRIR